MKFFRGNILFFVYCVNGPIVFTKKKKTNFVEFRSVCFPPCARFKETKKLSKGLPFQQLPFTGRSIFLFLLSLYPTLSFIPFFSPLLFEVKKKNERKKSNKIVLFSEKEFALSVPLSFSAKTNSFVFLSLPVSTLFLPFLCLIVAAYPGAI